MRFLVFMIPAVYQPTNGEPQPGPGFTADARMMAEMAKFNADLKQAGVLLSAEGLHPLTMGVRLAFSEDEIAETDGAAIDAKEVVGGYWLLQAGTKREVVDWMKRCPAQDGDVIEIRQIADVVDFSPDIQTAARSA